MIDDETRPGLNQYLRIRALSDGNAGAREPEESSADHDPGDEDRRPIYIGPWCENCGDAFDAPERPCPRPSPGRPYVDCGRGGHMFRLDREPGVGWRGWLS